MSPSLRSKRFRLVSEQRKTEERDSRVWPREKWNKSQKMKPPSLLFYLSHFSRGVWLSFLVLCSQTARKRLLRRLKVSWQAFPSLPPRAPLAFLPHLKLPFPSLSNACHAGYCTASQLWAKRSISRKPQDEGGSCGPRGSREMPRSPCLVQKRASHAGKSLGCSNRSSHSITNQGEKKTKV